MSEVVFWWTYALGWHEEENAVTEEEWATSTEPEEMLLALEGTLFDRKRRLFASACCRRVWPLLTEEASSKAVETDERFADGLTTADELDASAEAAWQVQLQLLVVSDGRESAAFASFNASDTEETGGFQASGAVWYAVGQRAGLPYQPERAKAHREEKSAQLLLLRDIFGNPFRPTIFDAAWRSETAESPASLIYEKRDFSLMPILGDALQDAGREAEEILGHCRGEGARSRGCFVLDLVLGKT